jgi:hypothetical protein
MEDQVFSTEVEFDSLNLKKPCESFYIKHQNYNIYTRVEDINKVRKYKRYGTIENNSLYTLCDLYSTFSIENLEKMYNSLNSPAFDLVIECCNNIDTSSVRCLNQLKSYIKIWEADLEKKENLVILYISCHNITDPIYNDNYPYSTPFGVSDKMKVSFPALRTLDKNVFIFEFQNSVHLINDTSNSSGICIIQIIQLNKYTADETNKKDAAYCEQYKLIYGQDYLPGNDNGDFDRFRLNNYLQNILFTSTGNIYTPANILSNITKLITSGYPPTLEKYHELIKTNRLNITKIDDYSPYLFNTSYTVDNFDSQLQLQYRNHVLQYYDQIMDEYNHLKHLIETGEGNMKIISKFLSYINKIKDLEIELFDLNRADAEAYAASIIARYKEIFKKYELVELMVELKKKLESAKRRIRNNMLRKIEVAGYEDKIKKLQKELDKYEASTPFAAPESPYND